jgi:hypothetical protein
MKFPCLLDESYFLDDNGKESLSKKLKYYAFFPLTAMALWLHTYEAFFTYGGLFVVDSGIGKISDSVKNVKTRKIESLENVATITNTKPAKSAKD